MKRCCSWFIAPFDAASLRRAFHLDPHWHTVAGLA
jgi:hypothetical protein